MRRIPPLASCLLLLALLMGCKEKPPAAQDTPAVSVAPQVPQAPQPGKKPASKEDAKRQDIRKLLVVTGSAEIGIQSLRNMVGQFRASMPNVPAAFWDEFMKEVSAEELVELIVPIYDKHYTHAEIKQLISFYETPHRQEVHSRHASDCPGIPGRRSKVGSGPGPKSPRKTQGFRSRQVTPLSAHQANRTRKGSRHEALFFPKKKGLVP